MSIVLWIGLIGYIVVCVIFNLAMINFWQEEKDSGNSEWSGNDATDLTGMFVASVFWPICVLYGLFKMKKEGK